MFRRQDPDAFNFGTRLPPWPKPELPAKATTVAYASSSRVGTMAIRAMTSATTMEALAVMRKRQLRDDYKGKTFQTQNLLCSTEPVAPKKDTATMKEKSSADLLQIENQPAMW